MGCPPIWPYGISEAYAGKSGQLGGCWSFHIAYWTRIVASIIMDGVACCGRMAVKPPCELRIVRDGSHDGHDTPWYVQTIGKCGPIFAPSHIMTLSGVRGEQGMAHPTAA
jgi:hypothetical protein